MRKPLLRLVVFCAFWLPAVLSAQSAAQLLQQAAEMDRLADQCHQRGQLSASSNNSSDAASQFAAERNYRLGAARLRQQAGQLNSSNGSYGGGGGASGQLGALQGAMNNAIGMMQVMQASKERQQREAEQAALAQEVAEAERANAAAQKALDDQRKLEAAKAQFSGFYSADDLKAFNRMVLNPQEEPKDGSTATTRAKAALDVAAVIGTPANDINSIMSMVGAADAANAIVFGDNPPTPLTIENATGKVSVTPANVHQVLQTAEDWHKFSIAASEHNPDNTPGTNYRWAMQVKVPAGMREQWENIEHPIARPATKAVIKILEIIAPDEKTKPQVGHIGVRG